MDRIIGRNSTSEYHLELGVGVKLHLPHSALSLRVVVGYNCPRVNKHMMRLEVKSQLVKKPRKENYLKIGTSTGMLSGARRKTIYACRSEEIFQLLSNA